MPAFVFLSSSSRYASRSAVALVLAAVGCAVTPAQHRQQLAGHVTPQIARAPELERVPASNELTLTIALPVRDRDGLWADVARVSDPASASYRRYLTPEEFGAKYGASPEDYQSVLDWARANGLATVAHTNR